MAKPLTGIADYRLYFDNPDFDLYKFWGDLLYKELFKDDDLIINLASKEYSKTITPFLKDKDKFVSLDFKDYRNGKAKSIVAWTKQMRGKMLKEIISKKIDDIDQIKKIEIDSYKYQEDLSKANNLVFLRRNR